MSTRTFHSKTSAVALLAERAARHVSPLGAMIEIADRCNEVCVHCYQVQGQKGEMTTEQIYGVLDELARMGVLFLTISGGEATLRSDFLDIVRRARELKFAVKLFTNGLTMTPELAHALGDLAVQEVQISLYSHRSDVHDWITKVPGSWEKTTAGVRFLRAERISVLVKTPMMSVNASGPDRDAYIALAEELDADWSFDPSGIDGREDGDRSPEALSASDVAFREALDDERLARKRTELPPERPLATSVCGACQSSVHIEPNGEIRPCSSLTIPLGNALEGGIAAAFLENGTAKSLRGLTWADLHGCRDCGLRSYCTRCFANSLRESGDALGPYARACRAARVGYEQAVGIESAAIRAEPTRNPGLGPYAIEPDGSLRCIDDVRADADLARANERLFVSPTPTAAPTPIGPSDLVQIRRPGKRPRLEQVPAATGSTRVAPAE